MFKKFVIGASLVAMLFSCSWYEHHFTRKNCKVIKASPYGAIFEDECGFTWAVEGSGYKVGQKYDLKMYDNLTSHDVDDDEILDTIRK